MEPGDRAAQAVRARTRIRLLAVVFVLVGLAFIQDPGYLVADTKFDLAVSPGHFLERALHLWDDEGAFGQLQNQAYGYLWPMGPFFLLFHALDVPGWVAQRLWQALVMSVAFLGTARVSRALGVRSDMACIVAGLAFALSPRMLTVLGPISIEAWPSALAPWVLLALIRGSTSGSPRRAAALAGLAVAMVGGVNAAATFAVIPLGVVWLLTRTPGPRRRSLMLWWPVFTLLGTLWWLIPLVLMGAYSPPFLDYIETTSVTTFPTTLFDALRGTSNWVPYVSADSRAGNELVTTAYLALNSGLVLLAGFAGVLDRRNPNRLFLALSVVVGLLMVTAGHQGAVQGLFSHTLGGLLDGIGAPLRNVHKFDPVIRLPLVLGVAFVVDRLVMARGVGAVASAAPDGLEQHLNRLNRATVLAMILVGVVGSTLPALTGRIEPAAPVASVPGYWKDAARWLAEHDKGETALLAPGSGFASYVWGSPRDEPLQFLARSAWGVRNVIPLAPAGNIRMLDAIEERLTQGKGSPGLAPYLHRNAVGYLVVRNDLRPGDDVPDPVLVHQTLAGSPGLVQAATFGPLVGGGAHLTGDQGRSVVNGGWQTRYPAVEIYAVSEPAVSADGGAPKVVTGGSEDLLDLEDLDLLGPQPVVLASDVGSTKKLDPVATGHVLTDGLQMRERNFARVHDAYSSVLTPDEEIRGSNPNRDYTVPGAGRWTTSAHLDGVSGISASSSGADADVPGGSRRGELPFAAVDGDEGTAWVSNPARENRTWWRITLSEERVVKEVTLTPGPRADKSQTVRVRTQTGLSKEVTAGPGERVVVDLPQGRTRWLQVESPDTSNRVLSLAEIDLDGLDVRRTLELPRTPRQWGNPEAVVLRAELDDRRGCAVLSGSVRCAEGKERGSEEAAGASRRFALPNDGQYVPELRVRPRAGPALDALITERQPVSISASSTGVPDPRASPLAAIDGDPATTWVAKASDFRPTLRLSWLGKKPIDGVSLSLDDDTAARLPRSLTLTWPGGTRQVTLNTRGRASFPTILTSQLGIRVDEAAPANNVGFDSSLAAIGVGIQELRISGLPYLPFLPSTSTRTTECGSGPTVEVNGTRYATAVRATSAELLAGTTLPASLCLQGDKAAAAAPSLDLRSGTNNVDVAGSDAFDFTSLTLRTRSGAASVPVGRASLISQSPVRVQLDPAPQGHVVNLKQNRNDGWQAWQAGRQLSPVRLNGWQQGWWQTSDQVVQASYAPDRVYRAGVAGGLVALLLLVLAAVLLRRRPADPLAPLGTGVLPWVPGQALALGAAALLAGWPGVAVGVVASLLAGLLRPRLPEVVPWVFASACFVASGAYFANPWADPEGWAGSMAWPNYLVLVPVVVAVSLAAGERPRFFQRIAGASMNR